MFCNELEFCRINVDFKEFKLNNVRFHFMTRPSPSSSSKTFKAVVFNQCVDQSSSPP